MQDSGIYAKKKPVGFTLAGRGGLCVRRKKVMTFGAWQGFSFFARNGGPDPATEPVRERFRPDEMVT